MELVLPDDVVLVGVEEQDQKLALLGQSRVRKQDQAGAHHEQIHLAGATRLVFEQFEHLDLFAADLEDLHCLVDVELAVRTVAVDENFAA